MTLLKSQLIQITNHNKPTVDEITKHLFDANGTVPVCKVL